MEPEDFEQEETQKDDPSADGEAGVDGTAPERNNAGADDAVSRAEMGALSEDGSLTDSSEAEQPKDETAGPSDEGEETISDSTEYDEQPETAAIPDVTKPEGDVGDSAPDDQEGPQGEPERHAEPDWATAEVAEDAGAVEEAEEEAEPAEVARRKIVLRLPSRKMTVSVAAGLVAGLLVAGWLTSVRARRLRMLAGLSDTDGGLLTPLDRAKKLIDEERYGEAHELVEAFLEETPPSAERSEGLFLLAHTMQALEQEHPTPTAYTEAREAYRKAIETDPSNPRVPDALWAIARTYLDEEMYQEARAAFEELARKYPNRSDVAEVEFEIAKTYLGQDDSSAAIRTLTSLITTYPDSELVPHAKLQLATALEREAAHDKASTLYRQVLSSFPTDPVGADAQEKLADLELARGNHAEAVALYKKRVEMAVAVTDNDRVLLKLARAYGAMGNWTESAATCRTLLEVFEESELEPEVIVQLCRAEEKGGHIDAALQYAYDGHTKFPENAHLLTMLAELNFRKQEYAEAARFYDKAVAVVPDDPDAWFKGGQAHLEAGDLESSNGCFREVTKRFASTDACYEAYLKLADIMYLRGDPQGAIDLLSSRLPEHVVSARRDPLLSKIATLYDDLGLPKLAAETYAKMLDGVEDDAILARMGIASLQAERWDTGLKALRRVDRSRVPPDLAYSMLVELGTALRAFGDLQGAVQALETAVVEYPDYRDARGVAALLRSYLAADRMAEARKLAKEIRSWGSQDTDRTAVADQAALVWGDYLFSRGDYLGALDEFETIAANEQAPDQVREWASYQKGNAYFELGRYDESMVAYRSFLEGYPSSQWKKAAQTRVDVAKLEMRLRTREF
jgi:tetratricopeptide (TPR) repeat protein